MHYHRDVVTGGDDCDVDGILDDDDLDDDNDRVFDEDGADRCNPDVVCDPSEEPSTTPVDSSAISTTSRAITPTWGADHWACAGDTP